MSVADNVIEQLGDDYPTRATAWVRDVSWEGPTSVPLSSINFDNESKWRAEAEPGKVEKFARKIQRGKFKPVILVRHPDSNKLDVVDGHHRTLAYKDLGRDPVAYVATVPSKAGPWLEMHASQKIEPSAYAVDSDDFVSRPKASSEPVAQSTQLDLGVSDVHVPVAGDTTHVQSQTAHKQLFYVSSKQRRKMPSSQFADPANKGYLIHDKAHADNASARLEQQKGSMSPGKYESIKRRIRAAQRRFGEKPKTNATALPATKGYRIRLTHPDGTHTVIQHQMSAVWLPSTSQLYTYLPIDKDEALSDGEPDSQGNKRVWVQIARTGAWSGHPQGPFVITTQTLDTIVDNFKTQKFGRIQWDFDHSSAMPANSGSLPVTGKPAQGWIYALRRDGDKLYALTQWLPLARQYIENDQYGGVSPVIDWDFKDRVSAKPVGPTITSVALTNLPFITGMAPPLAASLHGVTKSQRGPMALTDANPDPQTLSADSTRACYSAEHMIPKLKQVFGLHELTTAPQIKQHLANLRQHLEAVDGDGMAVHEGIPLGKYTIPLREMVNAHAGMDWYEVLDIIDDIIDSYMAEEGVPNPVGAPSTLPVVSEPDRQPTTPEDPSLSVRQTPVVASIESSADVTAASANAGVVPDSSVLLLRVAELTAQNTALQTQVSALSVKTATAEQQALEAEIDTVILTYKDTKGLTPELRPHLLSMLQKEPEAFRKMYPPVDADKQHLLLNLTGGRTPADSPNDIEDPKVAEAKGIVALSLFALTQKLITDSKGVLTVGAATIKADELLSQARKTIPQG